MRAARRRTHQPAVAVTIRVDRKSVRRIHRIEGFSIVVDDLDGFGDEFLGPFDGSPCISKG
jgi:hypothetical protein